MLKLTGCITHMPRLENGTFAVTLTTNIRYSNSNQFTQANKKPNGKKTHPNMAAIMPMAVIGAMVHPMRMLVRGDTKEIRPKVDRMRGMVKTWAASVTRRSSEINAYAVEKRDGRRIPGIGGAARAKRIMPKVARAESWKERSAIQDGLTTSMTATVSMKLNMLHDWRPDMIAKSAIQPIIADRTTLAEGPTNQTNPIIMSTVSKLAMRRLTHRRRIVMVRPDKIEMFMPESATICSVPVLVNASTKSADNAALVPNNMPESKPACGSGKSWFMMDVNVETVTITVSGYVSRPGRLQ